MDKREDVFENEGKKVERTLSKMLNNRIIKKMWENISQNNQLKKLWIFGVILALFCLYIKFYTSLIIIIGLCLFFTYTIRVEEKQDKISEMEFLEEEKKEIKKFIKVFEQYKKENKVTLEEVYKYEEAKELLEQIEKEIEEIKSET